MIKIAICDDDQKEIDLISSCAKAYFDASNQEYSIDHYDSAVNLLEEGIEYDLYLLDVIMPDCDGMTAARTIRDQSENAIIVFITSNLDSAVEGYGVEASGFLLKPLSADSFGETMDRLLKRGLIGRAPMLSVISRRTPMEIPISRIVLMESELHQIYIRTTGDIIKVNQRLDVIEKELANYPEFVRCHQSFLVNLNFVEDVLDGGFRLKEGLDMAYNIVPISRSRYKLCKMEFYQFRLNRLR